MSESPFVLPVRTPTPASRVRPAPVTRRVAVLGAVAAVGLGLAGCGGEPARDVARADIDGDFGRYKVGRPYTIRGVTYVPREDFHYDETGIASWYGPGFHGRRTANGEIYDQNALTAAHPTLQMPSLVRVTNLANGRSLVVRINDRGPFVRGRIIDLSRRGAELLGFLREGVTPVRVQVLTEDSIALARRAGRDGPIPAAGATVAAARSGIPDTHLERGRVLPDPIVRRGAAGSPRLFVQAGAFRDAGNARRLADRLDGIARTEVSTVEIDGARFHRVRLGPFGTVTDADRVLSRVISAGYPEALLRVD